MESNPISVPPSLSTTQPIPNPLVVEVGASSPLAAGAAAAAAKVAAAGLAIHHLRRALSRLPYEFIRQVRLLGGGRPRLAQ